MEKRTRWGRGREELSRENLSSGPTFESFSRDETNAATLWILFEVAHAAQQDSGSEERGHGLLQNPPPTPHQQHFLSGLERTVICCLIVSAEPLIISLWNSAGKA